MNLSALLLLLVLQVIRVSHALVQQCFYRPKVIVRDPNNRQHPATAYLCTRDVPVKCSLGELDKAKAVKDFLRQSAYLGRSLLAPKGDRPYDSGYPLWQLKRIDEKQIWFGLNAPSGKLDEHFLRNFKLEGVCQVKLQAVLGDDIYSFDQSQMLAIKMFCSSDNDEKFEEAIKEKLQEILPSYNRIILQSFGGCYNDEQVDYKRTCTFRVTADNEDFFKALFTAADDGSESSANDDVVVAIRTALGQVRRAVLPLRVSLEQDQSGDSEVSQEQLDSAVKEKLLAVVGWAPSGKIEESLDLGEIEEGRPGLYVVYPYEAIPNADVAEFFPKKTFIAAKHCNIYIWVLHAKQIYQYKNNPVNAEERCSSHSAARRHVLLQELRLKVLKEEFLLRPTNYVDKKGSEWRHALPLSWKPFIGDPLDLTGTTEVSGTTEGYKFDIFPEQSILSHTKSCVDLDLGTLLCFFYIETFNLALKQSVMEYFSPVDDLEALMADPVNYMTAKIGEKKQIIAATQEKDMRKLSKQVKNQKLQKKRTARRRKSTVSAPTKPTWSIVVEIERGDPEDSQRETWKYMGNDIAMTTRQSRRIPIAEKTKILKALEPFGLGQGNFQLKQSKVTFSASEAFLDSKGLVDSFYQIETARKAADEPVRWTVPVFDYKKPQTRRKKSLT